MAYFTGRTGALYLTTTGTTDPTPLANEKAYKLREAGELDECARLCSDVLNDAPHDVEALFCYGLLLITAERFGMAANVFARCCQLAPDSHEALTNFALSLISLNEFKESEQVLHRVLKTHPDYCPALNNMALLKVNQVQPNLEWY